jgi:hypothetical protein
MRREDVEELHFITSIANVPSILEHGILSNQGAKGVVHTSIAMEEVQSLRDTKAVPGGRRLHEYANLYFTARNPMMFKRKDAHAEICVLRISATVLELPGVVVADRNAARGWARFREPDAGLRRLEKDEVFADDWRHPGDPVAYDRHKGLKCAEVLVPERVPPDLIIGAYVSFEASRRRLQELCPRLEVRQFPHLFFGEGGLT